MGRGCYHTLSEDRDVLAYWLDLCPSDDHDPDDHDPSDAAEYLLDALRECLAERYVRINDDRYAVGEWSELHLELDPDDRVVLDWRTVAEDRQRGLALYHRWNRYVLAIRYINQTFPLARASSGWTYTQYAVGVL